MCLALLTKQKKIQADCLESVLFPTSGSLPIPALISSKLKLGCTALRPQIALSMPLSSLYKLSITRLPYKTAVVKGHPLFFSKNLKVPGILGGISFHIPRDQTPNSTYYRCKMFSLNMLQL